MKEYIIRRYYDSHHGDKFRNLQVKARTDKVKVLLSGFKKQQIILSHRMEVSDVDVNASFLTAKEIAVAAKPLNAMDLSRKVRKYSAP